MENNNRKHIDEDRLEAYTMNRLSEDETAIVEEHLLFCVSCQKQLEAVEHYVRAMRMAATRMTKEEEEAKALPGGWDRFRAWLHIPVPVWGGVAVLAGLLLAVGLRVEPQPGPPVDVELYAVRGNSTGAAPAGHALHLRLDGHGVAELPFWTIEIVDSEGARVWTGTGKSSDNLITATVAKAFKPGTFFVRLIHGEGDPAREYKLVIQ